MKNNESHIIISELITKSAIGSITDNEKEQLETWLRDEENIKLYNKIVSQQAIEEKIQKYRDFDKAKARQKILTRINNKANKKSITFCRLQWVKYAAAVVLIVCSGFLAHHIYLKVDTDHENIVGSKVIEPGKGKAILSLSDGKSINLELGSNQKVIANETVEIEQKQSTIKYSGKKSLNIFSKPKMNTLTIPRGGEWKLILADGTTVWLNSESELTYPVDFMGNRRVVKLKGEACFDVAKDEKKPFVVRANNIKTLVLGTVFNIRAYDDEDEIKTTLVEGKIEVCKVSECDSKIALSPNQQVVFSKGKETLSKYDVNAQELIAWKNGLFNFDNQSLDFIMNSLARWYDVEIEYATEDIRELKFSVGNLKRYDNFQEILNKFEKTNILIIRVENNKVIIAKKESANDKKLN